MIYLKSFVVGIVAAIVTSALWILVMFVLPVFGPLLLARLTDKPGTSDAVIGSDSILLTALAGFTLGFGWTLWRSRRRLVQR